MSKDSGYMFPDPIDPGETECIQVRVPKHALYIAAFWRAYEYFTTWHAWARDEAHTGKDVAALWQTCFDEAREIYVNGGGCLGAGVVLRMGDDCKLEVQDCDDPDVWRKVETVPTAGGSGGYDPKYDDPAPTLYPDGPPPGQDVACLAAANTVAMIKNGVDQFADLIELAGPLGDVIAFLYSQLIGLVMVVQSQLWLGLSVQYGNLDPETIAADAAAFDWDDWRCWLFDHYEADGTFTMYNHALGLDYAEGRFDDSQIWRVIYLIWSIMGSVGATLSTRWAGIEEYDCSGCGSWSHTWNAANGWAGWQPHNNDAANGVLSGGSWHSVNSGGYTLLILDSPHLTEDTNITRIVYKYTVTGSTPPYGQHRLNLIYSGGTTFNVHSFDWSAGSHELDQSAGYTQRWMQVDFEAPAGWQTYEITEVTFEGFGDDPYA